MIANPGNGPGTNIDRNYRQAIGRPAEAGASVVGYVPLGYGKRMSTEVKQDIRAWRRLYSGVSGIFFDEIPVPDGDGDSVRLRNMLGSVTAAARDRGYTLCIGNPGVPVPNWYFGPDLFDVVIVWENDRWPPATTVSMGLATSPERALRSAVLIYGDGVWSEERYRHAAEHLGFVFVNDHLLDVTGTGAYPWNYLPDNLNEQVELLADRTGRQSR